MIKNNIYFFWKGSLSQWHKSNFTRNYIIFNCCEQYMMFHKACLFLDFATSQKILSTNNPAEQKKLGREIKNFDQSIWDKEKFDIVVQGNYLKFSQNNNLKKILLDTDNLELAEASPYDNIWGIGLDENNPLAWNKETWKGENLLGKALMEVRNKLK